MNFDLVWDVLALMIVSFVAGLVVMLFVFLGKK
jgi:hypothetical protein